MRVARSTLIGTAVAMALFGRNEALYAQAQSNSTTAPATNELQEVTVTGIRASLTESLELKKKSTNVVDVITAEDIGKMPDKNVADSLKRVPGLTVSPAGANEGGFDENDRVSMRGTSPSLTQTLVDGHTIASGDWFVLDQYGTVGRSVSYTLLPSDMVGKVVVEKSSEASLVEGGVAGSVNIITRKPLDDFNKPFTFQASAGAVYSDLPSQTAPQFSALANWKNADSTFGVLAQGFYEDRYLRRDGTEILGYQLIGAGTNLATAHPDLANVWAPFQMGSAYFTQERKRAGGLLNVEWKPSDAVGFDLSGFYANLQAPNYNRNYLLWANHFINDGNGVAGANGSVPGLGIQPGYVVQNNTLVSANFAGVPGTAYGVYDQIDRPDASANSMFVNLDGNFIITSHFRVDGQIGWSEGHGKTTTENVSETEPGVGSGASYTLNGLSQGPNWGLTGVNYAQPFPPGNPQALTFGWIFGGQDIDTIDKETWAKLDATFDVSDAGNAWQDLRFGARYSQHTRDSLNSIAQGPTFSCSPVTPTCPAGGGADPAAYPQNGYQNYPSNYNTFGGNVPTGIWYWTPAQLAAYNGPGLVQRDPVQRAYPPYWFSLREPDTAVYVQADFRGAQWSANVGVRYVHTVEDSVNFVPLTTCTATIPPSANPCPASTPNLVVGSLFGAYSGVPTNESYNNVLPSANFRYQFNPDLVGRLAAAQTLTRADYSAISGSTNLLPPGAYTPGVPSTCDQAAPVNCGSGTAPNPYLKPIVSNNFDAGLEWYFAQRSILSATLFYMDLKNYVGFGTTVISYPTTGPGLPAGGVTVPFLLDIPINTSGKAQGVELAYQQAFGDFGIDLNYTYTDAKQTSGISANADGSPGTDALVGASKNVYNATGYYENRFFSARVSYNYRSSFYSGLDRSSAFFQDNTGTLAASLAWIINENFSLNLDGQNLNNPTLKYFALNQEQPRAFYTNGRQYYLTVRAKF